jgi:hypothetical protein
MAAHLTSSDCEAFKEVLVYPVQWMGLVVCCGMTVKRIGMLGVSLRKMKVVTVKMGTATQIGKGR